MQPDIHPSYYSDATVRCACGNTFRVGCTQPALEIEICSACHPFYTGKEKIIDTAGRVERYRRLVAKKASLGPRRKRAVTKTAAQ